jgi:cyclophilin family peptidyl-prolyl cis-trans isomerase
MNLALAPLLLLLAQAPSDASPTSPTPKPPAAGPVVVLETSMGRIRIGLNKDKAPVTVNNFIQYVRSGHYDGVIFHRVIPGFMIQGGGFEADMTERPTRPSIRNEARNGLRNLRGTIAMARTNAPDSATAQFFVNLKDNASLDFGIRGAGYAVFGEVLEGMDVVDKIALVPTGTKGAFGDVPTIPIVIKRAREEAATAPAPAISKPPAAAAPKP